MRLKGLYGRSKKIAEDTEYQPLIKHLQGASKYASSFCSKFKAKEWGHIAGLFHDAGKCSEPFQERLKGSEEKVDHSSYGGRYLFNRIKGPIGKALAFIICGHHGGLSNSLNGQTKDGHTSLHERLEKDIPDIPSSCVKEFDKINVRGLKLPKGAFQKYLFIKMVFSSLVDADRLDSEKYGNPETSALRGKYDSLPSLYKQMKKHMKKLQEKNNPTTINKLRTKTQKECVKTAWTWWNPFTWKRGFFTLTVPTGGGKTLTSMLFALRHAVHTGMDRIIYVIPYTSIIEQNAAEFRKIFGNNIIEHHCNLDKQIIEKDNLKPHHLATENWDAPIIVTTNVQFFESLYHRNNSRNRRIHNIVNSVVILDEAHLLPPRLLKPCVRILKELVKSYHCSTVFCTATQPGLLKESGFNWGVKNAREIIKDPLSLYKALERVEYKYRPDIKHDSQMANLMKKREQVLCIVNTRKHARIVYEDIKKKGDAYHLSTLMCARHRRKVIAQINEALKKKERCRIASTQLVECGVNLDLPTVIRNRSGVGNIIQSAGRCNREGLLDKGELIITNITGVGRSFPDDFIPEAENIATRYLKLGRNLLDYRVAKKAFIELFQNLEERLDKASILKIIENNGMEIPFEEISNLFNIIETDAISVIIPYDDEAMGLLDKLVLEPDNFTITRALQQYTVQVWSNDMDKIQYSIDYGIEPYQILKDMSIYDKDVGLMIYNSKDLEGRV